MMASHGNKAIADKAARHATAQRHTSAWRELYRAAYQQAPRRHNPSAGLHSWYQRRGETKGKKMVLSERQQLARNLANELGKMDGVWVTSPLPLDDNAKLRLQILDSERNHVVQAAKDWGWNPVCISVLPRVHSTGLIAACLYEIDLPRERQPIHDDRIYGELAKPEKTDHERMAVLKYLGLRK